MNKLKICVVTGGRADYGLLRKLMRSIDERRKYFKLQVIVTGAHLYKQFGNTINEIQKDKFRINRKIYLNIRSDTPVKISESISIGVKKMSIAFEQLNPDLIIILGDRYEIMSSAIAGHILNIPIAHIHGGEITEGAIDDAIRHSITKMSDFHFVANDIYKKRVIQLGENPKNIFMVGGLGVDLINIKSLYSRREIEQKLNFKFNKKNLLITYHPETLRAKKEVLKIDPLIKSLKKLKYTNLIFTVPNSDTFNAEIFKKIKKFSKQNKNCYLFSSLGHKMYHSCLKHIDGVIGNSSSGISEVPFFKKGTLNIGDRQKGRLRVKSIIDVKMNTEDIDSGLKKLYSKKFNQNIKKIISPYGKGGATKKIVNVLEKIKVSNLINIKKKKFFDLRF
tara:strand:- start:1648 stop:2823 length:1176 start_codon:yes stop_codon:yes gene_type:complete